MSSELQSALDVLQMTDYVSVITVTVVVYDYFLAFSKEIDFVCCKPWTWTSTGFLLVRYVGLLLIFTDAFFDVIFVPDTQRVSARMFQVANVAYQIFLFASDLTMIFRVYQMWNRSKAIFYVLLFIFMTQTIAVIVIAAIYNNPNHLSVTSIQVADLSFCASSYQNTSSLAFLGAELPRFILGVTLFILAVVLMLKEAVELYKRTQQWKSLNPYMKLFVRHGALYFFVNALINVLSFLSILVPDGGNDWTALLLPFCDMCMFLMMPRFIIDMEELNDGEPHGHWERISAAFGESSQPVASENISVPAIELTNVTPSQGDTGGDMDDSEGIRLEARVGSTSRV